ncbi:protein jagged-1-like [Lytechinus pictus]|uniref:protein jagged-1-like n=1 Tax=Lytechinus pictus TaxID=7653 RepID=UPI0030B9F229
MTLSMDNQHKMQLLKVAITITILKLQAQSILADGTCPVILQDSCPYGIHENTGEVVKLVPKYLSRDHPEYDVRTPKEAKGKINLYCAPPACSSNVCLNGGTCMEKLDGFRCLCPENAFGTYCEVVPLYHWLTHGI